MSKCLHMFQMLVTIPNAPPKELPEHVRSCLSELQAFGFDYPGHGVS